jgi:hypothetical protein
MSQPLENAASGGIRERGERGIQVGSSKLNHMVQFILTEPCMQGEDSVTAMVRASGSAGRRLQPAGKGWHWSRSYFGSHESVRNSSQLTE